MSIPLRFLTYLAPSIPEEFFAAIAEGRESRSSVGNVFPCYETMHLLEEALGA